MSEQVRRPTSDSTLSAQVTCSVTVAKVHSSEEIPPIIIRAILSDVRLITILIVISMGGSVVCYRDANAYIVKGGHVQSSVLYSIARSRAYM